MDFSELLKPLLKQCRQRFEEWSLVLQLEAVAVGDRRNEKYSIAHLPEERFGPLSVNCGDQMVTAIGKEVRFKVSEPCISLSQQLRDLSLCEHCTENQDEETSKILKFCSKHHVKTFMNYEFATDLEVSDSAVSEALSAAFSFHLQSAEKQKIYGIQKIVFPIIFPKSVFIVCTQGSAVDILLYDKDGWNIGEVQGITFDYQKRVSKVENFSKSLKQANEKFNSPPSSAHTSKPAEEQKKHQNAVECITSSKHASKAPNEKSGKSKTRSPLYPRDERSKYRMICRTHLLEDKQSALQGSLKGNVTDSSVKARIQSILVSFQSDYISDEESFFEMGLDSLQLASFEYKLRSNFANEVALPDGCVFEHSDLDSLAQFIENRLNRRFSDEKIGHTPHASDTPPRRKRLQKIPLSAAQKRLVFMAKLDGENDAQFLEQFSVELRNLKVKQLVTATNRLIARQTILRTKYTLDAQEMLSLSESYISLSLQKTATKPEVPNIFEDPPVIFQLQKTDGSHLLTVIQHHILTDGHSTSILARELKDFYEGKSLGKLKYTYTDFAEAENKALQNQEFLVPRETFWRHALNQLDTQQIPTDSTREALQSHSGKSLKYMLQESTLQKIKVLRSRNKVTTFTVLVATYHALLNRIYGITDYCIGITVSQRNAPQADATMGCFVSLIPLLVKTSDDDRVSAFIANVARNISESTLNQLPLDHLVSLLNLERDLSTSPFFQVMLVQDNFNFNDDFWLHSSSGQTLTGTLRSENPEFAKYDQIWYFENLEDNAAIRVEYSSKLFYNKTIQMQIEKFLKLIDEMYVKQTQTLSELTLKTCQERLERYEKITENTVDFPINGTAIDIMKAQSLRNKYCNRLKKSGVLYSNGFLLNRSEHIARNFVDHNLQYSGESIKPDDSVVLLMDRSVDVIATLIGFWSCGLAVVPLSTSWPPDRIAAVIENLNCPPVVVSNSEFILNQVRASHFRVQAVDEYLQSPRRVTSTRGRRRQCLQNLAYITFTSGTTGLPKGVCTEFEGLNNLAMNYSQILALCSSSSVYQVVNYAFDIFFADVLEAFTNGGTLHLAESQIPHTDELRQVSHAYIMPAYLSAFDDKDFLLLTSLTKLHFGGDTVQPNFLKKAIQEGIDVHQQYGMTEHTVYSTCYRTKHGDKVSSVGRTMRNIHAEIRDSRFRSHRANSSGICCTFGTGLSRGYFKSEGTTMEKFKLNDAILREDQVLWKNAKCFITGDLTEMTENRIIKFYGRSDGQVKIRGQMLDLCQIEYSMSQHNLVRTCFATTFATKNSNVLVAYITTAETADGGTVAEDIKEYLLQKMPSYMVPSKIFVLKEFPVTSNGKVDRAKLKLIFESAQPEKPKHIPKKSGQQEQIYKIFEEVLGRQSVSPDESFFEVGGDSLKALLIAQKLERDVSVILHIKDIFQFQTFGRIVEHIRPRGSSTDSSSDVQIKESKRRKKSEFWLNATGIPLSYGQQGLWFLSQLDDHNDHSYLLFLNIEIKPAVSVKLLRNIFNYVVQEQTALRTVIKAKNTEPNQFVLSLTEAYVSIILDTAMDNKITVSLTESPPMVVRVSISEGRSVVQIAMHHAIVDGHSFGILIQAILRLLENVRGERSMSCNVKRKDLKTYQEFSIEQRKKFESTSAAVEARITALRSAEPLELPYDFPRQKAFEPRAKHLRDVLDIPRNTLDAFCERHQCTLFTLLLAGYALLMRTLSGMKRFAIGMPVANRCPDTMNTVGLFTNTVIIDVNTEFEKVDQLLTSLQSSVTQSLEFHDFPFEILIKNLNPERDHRKAPHFQHSIVMHDVPQKITRKTGGLEISFEGVANEWAKYDQTWFFADNQSSIAIDVEYCSALFRQQTVERDVEMLKKIVSSLLSSKRVDEIPCTPISFGLKEDQRNALADIPQAGLSNMFTKQQLITPRNILTAVAGEAIAYNATFAFAIHLCNKISETILSVSGETLAPDDCIVIECERNLLAIITMLAVLLLGCSYCPLDPAYPEIRKNFIIQNSQAKAILSFREKKYDNIRYLNVKSLYNKWNTRKSTKCPKTRARAHCFDLAYIMYTSGTTGKPKGVCVEQLSVSNVIQFTTKRYTIKPQEKILEFTSLTFDASVAYIYGAILNGATICNHDENESVMTNIRNNSPIDVLHMTPAVLNQIPANEFPVLSENVRLWSVGGDKLNASEMQKPIAAGIPLLQVYGPTEATVFQATMKMKMATQSPETIGQCIDNLLGYVISVDYKRLPYGIEGEFFMVGPNVARGYMNLQKETKCLFVENKFATREDKALHRNAVGYKSGDNVVRLPSGEMVFHGRKDAQVKIRGYRIELAEIETAVSSLQNVTGCVAILQNNGIDAYYTGGALPENYLKERLSNTLPYYMIPSKCIHLEKFPLNSNSKIDKAALAKYSLQHSEMAVAEEATTTTTEEKLLNLWKAVLGKNLTVNDNFFAAGGHSLLATALCFKIKEELNCECQVSFLFEHQTVRALARKLCFNESNSVTRKTVSVQKRKIIPVPICDLQKPIAALYLNNRQASLAYKTGFNVKIVEEDFATLRRCLNRLILKHSALRTSFSSQNGILYQTVFSGSESFIALQSSPEKICDLPNPFESVPIASVVWKPADESYLTLVMSHLIVDGRSMQIIAEELFELCQENEERKTRKTGETYRDFTTEFHKNLEKHYEKNITYWTQLLGEIKIKEFDIPEARHMALQHDCKNVKLRFPKLNKTIKKLAAENQCSQFSVLLSAFGDILLSRLKDSEKVVVACPFDVRTPSSQNTVGLLVNTLPVALGPLNKPTKDKLSSAFSQLKDALDHSAISTEVIAETCLKGQLVKTMLVTEDYSPREDNNLGKSEEIEEGCEYAKYELTLFVKQRSDDVEVRAEYMKHLYHREYIAEIINDWAKCISQLTTEDRAPEAHSHLTQSDIPHLCLPSVLENAALLRPEKESLFNKKHTHCYTNLRREIFQIAGNILQSTLRITGECLRVDTIVPIVAQKKLQTLVLCLGTLFSGASYLPIDEATPKQRTEKLINEIGAEFYLAEADLRLQPLQVIHFDDVTEPRSQVKTKFRYRSHSDALAYVMFTSGTTGEPKGVGIEQVSVVNLATQSTRNFLMSSSDCVYQFTNFCFDNSVLEMIMALSNGCSLFVKEGIFTVDEFTKEISEHSITHALLFPGLVDTFSRTEIEKLNFLRYWIVGAEKVTETTLNQALGDGTHVIQNYGPTETTAYTLFKHMHKLDHPNNLGKAIDNVGEEVRKPSSQEAPTFTAGELFLTGINVMRGYLGKRDCTYDASKKPMKSYASGDLVRKMPDGNIIFIGRRDEQVKIRGFRIELTEIETVLREAPNVRQAKVLVREPNQQLAAFVVPTDPAVHFNTNAVVDFCKQRLPYYMVPSHFHCLDKLPLTSNSKIDVRQLQATETEKHRTSEDLPKNVTEFQLWQIFKCALSNENVSVEDDFFMIGGNSLLAKRIVEDIEREIGEKIPVRSVFEQKTVRAIAGGILSKKATTATIQEGFNNPTEKQISKKSLNWIPLSYQQQQMYFLNRTRENQYYNLLFTQTFPPDINLKLLHQSFQRLLLKHSSLRTIYKETSDIPYQFILSGTETYYSPLLRESETEVHARMGRLRTQQFDLTTAPLVICLGLTEKRTSTILMLIFHIACDAWSTRLIETEMSQLYKEITESKFTNEKALYTYVHYAVEQQKPENKTKYRKLSDEYAQKLAPHILSTQSFWLDDSLTSSTLTEFTSSQLTVKSQREFLTLCSNLQATPFTVILAAFSLAIHKLTNRSKIVIAVPVANRTNQTAEVIGNFLNNLLICSTYNGEEETSNLKYTDALRKQIEDVQRYEVVPFVLLLASIRETTETKFVPEIIFNCRYHLEDEATNKLSSCRSSSSMDKCVHAVEADVDMKDGAYTCTVRVHERAREVLKGENLASLMDSILESLLDENQLHKIEARTLSLNTTISSPMSYPKNKITHLELSGKELELFVRSKLWKIWTECLGSKLLRETDDFFFSGGNSLLCLKLQRLIREEFSIQVRIEELFKNSSFMEMCTLIKHTQNPGILRTNGDIDFTTLMLTNERFMSKIFIEFNKKPEYENIMVFFHPLVGGVVFPYANLIRSLNEKLWDFWMVGVQHPDSFNQRLMTDDQFHQSIENLCSMYVNTLWQKIRKMKRCILVGASLGGILSYEVATQLLNKGMMAERIICIDSTAAPMAMAAETLEQHKSQTTRILEKYSKAETVEHGLSEAIIGNSWDLLQLVQKYIPKPDKRISANLLRVEDDQGDYGWNDLCNATVSTIPGTHETMLNEANSETVANVIAEILRNKA